MMRRTAFSALAAPRALRLGGYRIRFHGHGDTIELTHVRHPQGRLPLKE
jgi:hypothetical protein